jgi:hypothetical protein
MLWALLNSCSYSCYQPPMLPVAQGGGCFVDILVVPLCCGLHIPLITLNQDLADK